MGLDWNPLERPKPGHEAEFERLFHFLYPEAWDADGRPYRRKTARVALGVEEAWARLERIGVHSYSVLGAPQIGRDRAADDFARERYRERQPTSETEAEFLQSLKGAYVAELAPPSDGMPYYSHGGAGALYTSFRAEFIVHECPKVIGNRLLERCFHTCLAPGLAALGAAIRDKAEAYAAKHVALHVRDLRVFDEPYGNDAPATPARRAHILFSAARWCAFWSKRGFGMEADW
jgi:hypothetical protein